MKPRDLAIVVAGLASGVGVLGTYLARSREAARPPAPALRAPLVRAPRPRWEPPLVEPAPEEQAGAVNAVEERTLPPDSPPAELREGKLAIDVPLREWGEEGLAARPRFAFFDGEEREIVVDSHQLIEDQADGGVVVGRVAGAPGSWVVLAHVDDAVAGTLYVPGQGLYRVRTRAGGELRLTQLDPEKIPEEALPLVLPPGHADELAGDAALPPPVVAEDPVPLPDATVTVDLMVVYTPATASANGGTSGIVALANAAVATSNLAYQNSLVALGVRLVRTQQTTYTESHGLATDLGRLTSTSDGYMDEIHAARVQAKADLVSLFVTGSADAAGVAYLWSPSYSGTSFSTLSFSVVLDAYADSNITLAHEMGHNMGCGHAPGDGGGSGGAYAYSSGHRFTGNNGIAYRTVMAYAPGTRIPYFSNPGVSYQGVATGVSNSADNALTLTGSRSTIASFMTGLTAAEQDWHPIATGDFDADGKTDLVWRNVGTGRVIVWLMDGTTRTSAPALWSGDPAWVPITTGDFNGDGKVDLVWRNSSTGRTIVWLMDGTTMTSTAVLWTGDPAWVPVVAKDLNGDGAVDLMWRNSSTGRTIAWLMSGTTMTSSAVLWSGTSAWVLRAAGAFDGDSNQDLVWRNSTDGRVIVWFMNGTTMASSTPIWQ